MKIKQSHIGSEIQESTQINGYALISPCRNEAEFMRQTIESVLNQTILPALWVIVDDGSSDDTPNILIEYASKYDLIRIVSRQDRGHRSVGPGVVDAFYAGYETIKTFQFEFIRKLDLDLRLPPRYFEILIKRMREDDRIATCSGKAYLERNREYVCEGHGDDTSLGMTKFYRTICFEAIGGFVRQVMWDGIDCHRCRMLGWKACSWDEPELRFIHLRAEGSSQNSVYRGRIRHGFGQYFMGTGFIFMFASAVFRIAQRPYVTGSLAMLWGWLASALQRKPRYEDEEFRRFLRRYHWRVLIMGKRRALRYYE